MHVMSVCVVLYQKSEKKEMKHASLWLVGANLEWSTNATFLHTHKEKEQRVLGVYQVHLLKFRIFFFGLNGDILSKKSDY